MVDTLYLFIGIAIMVGLAMVFSYISKVEIMKGIIAYSLVIAPFVYRAGLLDLWVIILLLFFNLGIIFSEIRRRAT